MLPIDLFRFSIPHEYVEMLPENIARENEVIAIGCEDGALLIAVADLNNHERLEKLQFILNQKIAPILATAAGIEFAIKRYYGAES
jgi:type IV pilus assembly protein PilB